jgi:hypothetical protein
MKGRFEFLQKKCDSNQVVMLCPRCSSIFDKAAAKAFERLERKKIHDERRVYDEQTIN